MRITPYELQAKFTADDLPGQYILSLSRDVLPAGWSVVEKDGWFLAYHSLLPCLSLTSSDGTALGFLLGFPITDDGILLTDEQQGFTIDAGLPFESSLYSLSGRWLAIVLTDEEQLVYLDPNGTLPAVYCPSQSLVAATPGLLPYTEETGDRQDLVQEMPIPEVNAVYPVGMTTRHGVEQLLPNHKLDLRSWQARRHWSTADLSPIEDTTAAVREIADITKRNIAAVAARYPLLLSLTAGRDSRTILACARPFVEESLIFTSILPGITSVVDVNTAARITKSIGLKHHVYPFIESSPREKELWLFRSGYSAGNYLSYISMRSSDQLDKQRAYLPGFGTEVTRYYYADELTRLDPAWRDHELTAETLVYLTRTPATEAKLAYARNWLANMPLTDPQRVADLFYVEQREGADTVLNNMPFADKYAFELWPLNDRRIVEIMLMLPDEYRKAARLNTDIIGQEWPELLNFEFNQPRRIDLWEIKFRRLLRKVQRK